MANMKRFNEHMGKVQKLSKGGLIKKIAGRHYFDDGGSTTLAGPTQSTGGNSTTVNNNGLTGNVASGLGLNNNFQATAAPIQAGTNAGQLNNAYTGAQSGLAQQQQLADTVAGQAGQGVNTQNELTGQLEGVVNGTGPNAAQAQLAQNTSTNVANQAALMAGQRGASANAGLVARQAAQQGAATQQQAAGQAATTQAQQQIAAQQQLAGLAGTQIGQTASAVQGVNSAQQNEQNILQGANTSLNNANVSQQSNLNSVNAGVASGNQAAAGTTLNGIASGGGSFASVLGSLVKGGEVGVDGGTQKFDGGGSVAELIPAAIALLNKGGDVHHCAGASCTDRAHYAHMMAQGGPLSVAPAPSQGGEIGPWLNSAPNTSSASISNAPNISNTTNEQKSSGSKPSAKAPQGSGSPQQTGSSPNLGVTDADNTVQGPNLGVTSQDLSTAPGASSAPTLGVSTDLGAAADAFAKGGNICKGPHQSHVANYLASGGEVPAMVSAKERYLNPEEVRKVIEEGKDPMKLGQEFKGKASVKGNSLKNDTIPKTLEEGGCVIPRSITTMKGPHKSDKAALFIHKAVHMRAPGGAK